MAKLIETGETQAIDLKALHGSQIKELDEAVAHNRFAYFLMHTHDGVLQLLETFLKTDRRVLRPPKKRTLN